MELFSLQDLLIHDLRDLHSAEEQLVAALPRMQRAASTADLRDALGECAQQSQERLQRLEGIFAALREAPEGKQCHAIAALLEANKRLVTRPAHPFVMDAALIGAAQRILHYKIAGYGCLIAFAELLELSNAAETLRQMLAEEKEADEKLIAIASKINRQARDDSQ